jgi:Tfp pilus assembly protein PilF
VPIVIAVIGFLPPWLSATLTRSAYGETPATQSSELQWARRLDPLSVDPLLVQAGLAYLRAHRRADARRELAKALRLSPHDPVIQRAYRRAR